jgi:hypothetical protein
MTEVIKVLGQSKPAAATLTPLYAVPALNSTVVSTITACEQAGSATSFRLSVAVAAAADAPEQYFVYDLAIAANETRTFTLGITLGAADVIRCRSLSGSVSFAAFGAEAAP